MLTGADPYYCAGVNFGDAIRAGNPAKLHKMVKQNNAAIFNAFIQVYAYAQLRPISIAIIIYLSQTGFFISVSQAFDYRCQRAGDRGVRDISHSC